MESLPPEVTRLCIAPLAKTKDCASVSATSPTLRIIAQESLYARLHLSGIGQVRQLAHILAQDDLEVPGRKRGHHVQSIKIDISCLWAAEVIETVREILRLVPHLESISMGLSRRGKPLLATLRENCPKLRKLELIIEGRAVDDAEAHLNELARFTTLEEFTFTVQPTSLWTIYEIPRQIVTMLTNSPSLKSLSIHGYQGRGWSLDVAPLLLTPYRPSLRSLTLQGVACNLSIENFESDNRQLAEFFLSLVDLEELSLGGSVGRRNLELRMMMKDALEEGERETLFPKLRQFEGTSTNDIWLMLSGITTIDTLTTNVLEPIDEAEYGALLIAMPTTMVEASICFARYDPLRPTVESAIERIAVACPRLRRLSIDAVSSLRFSARSMTRVSVPSHYPSIIQSITNLPLLSSLHLPPHRVCGIDSNLADVASEFFEACSHLLRLDFAGEPRDGHSGSVEATRWERRCTREGKMIAVDVT